MDKEEKKDEKTEKINVSANSQNPVEVEEGPSISKKEFVKQLEYQD